MKIRQGATVPCFTCLIWVIRINLQHRTRRKPRFFRLCRVQYVADLLRWAICGGSAVKIRTTRRKRVRHYNEPGDCQGNRFVAPCDERICDGNERLPEGTGGH